MAGQDSGRNFVPIDPTNPNSDTEPEVVDDFDDMSPYRPFLDIETLLHPPAKRERLAPQLPEGAPQSVFEKYEEAADTLSVSAQGAVSLLRVAGELLCEELGADASKRLFEKIGDISHRFDTTVVQALHLLRSEGNAGAHPSREWRVSEALAVFQLFVLLIEETYGRASKRESINAKFNAVFTEDQRRAIASKYRD